MLSGHRIVVVPPHDAFRVRVPHYELVLGAASGMRARIGDERATGGDLRLVALQRVLVELRRAEVPVDRLKIAEAKPVRAEVEIMRAVLDHPEHSPFKVRLNACAASHNPESLPTLCGDDLARPGRGGCDRNQPYGADIVPVRCSSSDNRAPTNAEPGGASMGPGQRRHRTRNASALGDRERPDRGRLGRRHLVLFCNWPVEDRFRLVRP